MAGFQLICVFVVALTASIKADHKTPTLEIQPNTGTVKKQVGMSLALTCKPNVENPKLITQLEWRDPKNRRIEVRNRNSPLYVQDLFAETGLILIFSSLSENDDGNYSCSANYATSEHIQAAVTVETFVDITFVDAPLSQYPKAGEDFTVKCKVQGKPAPIIDWNKNDQAIVTNDRYVVGNEGLIIKNVRESDDGVYKCMAYVLNTGQFQSRNIKVEVIVPPKVNRLDDVSVIEGETASTKCTATGKPPPKYTWIKESTSQNLSKSDRFDVKQNTGELIITRVEFNDNSRYKCIAENLAGRAEMTTKITVMVKPRIFEFINVTAPYKSETKIICKAQGWPTPTITFRKFSSKEPFRPGQQLLDKRVIVEHDNIEQKGESFATLIITSLNRTDDGLYECMAENTAGTAYKNGHITVEFPPTFERTKNFPPAWSWASKPGNLTCLPEAIPNATIIWRYNNQPIVPSVNFDIIGQGPVSHLIVKPLHNDRFYTKYECVATNKHGQASNWIQLKEAKVPGHVMQIKQNTITATTIKFDLEPPTYFDSLPIKTFVVQYRPEVDAISWDYARNYTWSFRAPYILENLTPEVTYHFRFAATNEVGQGPFTNGESITMPRRSEPAEPKIISSNHIVDDNSSNRVDAIIISPYADHYELRWNVPNDNGDPIDSYIIRFCVIDKINGQWRDSDCSDEIKQSVQYTTFELNGLRADTTYKIELRAHNAIGSSSPAQIRVKTARGVDPAIPYNEPTITSAAIIGIVVASVVLVVLVIDVTCFCVNRSGILALICNRSKSKQHEEEDPKLGREEREPLRPDHHHHPVVVNGEKNNMSVEFDGNHVYSKSGEIIGKHSAV